MGVIERRKREREVRRELAIDAAMSIYDEEGYHAITMEKIAARSELSRAALYLYFKSKEEILVSAIVAHADYFARLLNDVYDNREAVKDELLDKLWDCFRNFYEKDPVTFTAWQYFHQRDVIGNLPAELKDILHESGAKVVALQHKIVEYAVREKVFLECDPRALSEIIWSLFLGIIYVELSKNVLSQKSHLDFTRDLAVAILSRGVAKPPHTGEAAAARVSLAGSTPAGTDKSQGEDRKEETLSGDMTDGRRGSRRSGGHGSGKGVTRHARYDRP